jgi:flagellar protein FlgJ
MDAPGLPPTGITAPPTRPAPTSDRARALAAARDFEAVFLADALKTMMQDIHTDPLESGTGSESWRELLADEYAKALVRRGGIGLAEPIADELMKIQEASSP